MLHSQDLLEQRATNKRLEQLRKAQGASRGTRHSQFAPANPHTSSSVPESNRTSIVESASRPRVERHPSTFAVLPSALQPTSSSTDHTSPFEVSWSYERSQASRDRPSNTTLLSDFVPVSSFHPFANFDNHTGGLPLSSTSQGNAAHHREDSDSVLSGLLDVDEHRPPHWASSPSLPSQLPQGANHPSDLRRTSSSRDLYADLSTLPHSNATTAEAELQRRLQLATSSTTPTHQDQQREGDPSATDDWDQLSNRTRARLIHAERMCMTPSELRLISRVSASRTASFDMVEVLARRRYNAERSQNGATAGSSSTSTDDASDRPLQPHSSVAAETQPAPASNLQRSSSIRRSGFRIGPSGTPRTLERGNSTSSRGSRLSRRPVRYEVGAEGSFESLGGDAATETARDFELFTREARQRMREADGAEPEER